MAGKRAEWSWVNDAEQRRRCNAKLVVWDKVKLKLNRRDAEERREETNGPARARDSSGIGPCGDEDCKLKNENCKLQIEGRGREGRLVTRFPDGVGDRCSSVIERKRFRRSNGPEFAIECERRKRRCLHHRNGVTGPHNSRCRGVVCATD